MVLWDVEDPQATSASAFAAQVVAEARPGSIILLHVMHPANETARQALPLILDGLDAKGLQVVSVGTLLQAARERAATDRPPLPEPHQGAVAGLGGLDRTQDNRNWSLAMRRAALASTTYCIAELAEFVLTRDQT